ncbi:MAG: peptidoglycan-binding protein [Planctomycetes bacterium]|nr:peptidoglycan-binding protein [Planctomycetota bacterium]
MGLKTTTPKKKPASPWPIAIALAIAVFVMQSLITVIWSSTRPETISAQEYNDLQSELTSQAETQKTALAGATREMRSAQLEHQRLQGENAHLKQQASNLLRVERLPIQVRGVTPSQCIGKIQRLCDVAQQVNQDNVSALLAVLVEIQKNSVINTALDAKSAARKNLYRQIQTLLREIDAYGGPVRSDKTSTLAAVKAYQTQSKLKVDGKIGINTLMTMVRTFQKKRLSQTPTPTI